MPQPSDMASIEHAKPPELPFAPTIHELITSRLTSRLTVLSGPNNNGKTLVLKKLRGTLGEAAHFVGVDKTRRFQTFDVSRHNLSDPTAIYQHFNKQYSNQEGENFDNADVQLNELIRQQDDDVQNRILEVCSEATGCTIRFEHTIPNRRTSPWLIVVDGYNIKYASTGIRAIVSLLLQLADCRFRYAFVDEPEQCLSPILQSRLAEILFAEKGQHHWLSHIDGLFIATHSHLLLDRNCISNNFIVQKTNQSYSITQVHKPSEFHDLQFAMLGNTLESVFMPAAVIIVEGPSDQTFLNKVLKMRLPNRHITVIRGGGDGEMQKKLHTLKEMIGDLVRSPYYDRIFVVLDATHSAKSAKIAAQGIKPDNIIVWSSSPLN